MKVPEGLIGKLVDASAAARGREVSAAHASRRCAVPGDRLARRRGQSRQAAAHQVLAGGRRHVHHVPDGHHARPEARHPQRRHVSHHANGARRRSPCTGSGTKSARRTGARWRSAARRCPSASPSAPTRRRCTRRARRSRRRSTSSCSRDSCAEAPVSLTKALTCDLEVPAEADFVIEGVHRSRPKRS